MSKKLRVTEGIIMLCVFAGFLLCTGLVEAAEQYPNKPINMIVGFAPGGASDLGSKIVSNKMEEFLGQPLVANYKPGGGGTLSASYVARAKPDGYTALVMVSFMNLPPEAAKLDYKLDDFALTGDVGPSSLFHHRQGRFPVEDVAGPGERGEKIPG